MKIEFNWHIPCAGDGHWMCTRMPERLPHVEYLTQVARAAEYAGFDRVLVPCAFSNGNYSLDAPYVDSYTLGTAVVAATHKLEVLIAHRPGFINPGVFAQMCSTLDDVSGDGRRHRRADQRRALPGGKNRPGIAAVLRGGDFVRARKG